MSDNGQVRLEIVVDRKDTETTTDVGMRVKRLLRGMEREPFESVDIRRSWYGDSNV